MSRRTAAAVAAAHLADPTRRLPDSLRLADVSVPAFWLVRLAATSFALVVPAGHASRALVEAVAGCPARFEGPVEGTDLGVWATAALIAVWSAGGLGAGGALELVRARATAGAADRSLLYALEADDTAWEVPTEQADAVLAFVSSLSR